MQTLFLFLSISLLACLSVAFVQRSPLPSGLSISQHERSSSSQLHMFDFLKPKDEDKAEEVVVEEEEPAADFSDDPIDKIFGFFFGAKEEAPMGMKRFGMERFPEQYPAVLDEWAAPVAGDDKEVAALRPMLKKTNMEFRNLKVGFVFMIGSMKEKIVGLIDS